MELASRSHIAELDGLRALSALAVIYGHTCPLWDNQAVFQLRFWGVWCFFVLSGYLITRILLRQKASLESGKQGLGRALKVFYVRRSLRIFPLYYVVLTAAVLYFGGRLGLTKLELLAWFYTYLSNVYMGLQGEWAGMLSHFWSLAVEEQFYLVWPAFILLTPRRFLLRAVLGSIAVALIYRAIALALGMHWLHVLASTLSNIDCLGLGALLAVAQSKGRRFVARPWILLVAGSVAVLLVVAIKTGVFGDVNPHEFRVRHESTFAALFFAGIVNAFSLRERSGWWTTLLTWRPLAYVGTISYGVYLLHNFVVAELKMQIESRGMDLPPPLLWFALVSLVTVALAALCWHTFEKRTNGLKRFFGYRSGAPAASTSKTS